MLWRCRDRVIDLTRPQVMGILNVTPDSFSDGGKYFRLEAAVARGEELARQGADLIDVGGESTRPNATPVGEIEELRRVLPVIVELSRRVKIPLSIVTMKPAVAQAAVKAGASLINDVAAHREDETMWRTVAETGAGYLVMHMQGTPQTMQENPVYADVVGSANEFFEGRLRRLKDAGIKFEQLALDAGIGFGKTVEHNLQLLAGLRSFTNRGRPLVIGVSRKSFLGRVSGGGESSRLPAALACTTLAAEAGVQMFRTHDVPETIGALRMTEAILARKNK